MSTDTKIRLIETAIELIWRESYNAVSVDEICKKADVKKGSFYHYFPSKAHLAVETMEHCMGEIKSHYDDMFSPTRDPVERFSLMISYVIEQQKKISNELGHVCGCPIATLGSEIAAQDEMIGKKITDICKKKTSYYESALRDMVAAGIISSGTDVAVKADEIFAFIIGQLIMARINNDLGFVEDNLERGLFDLIGMGKTEEKSKKLTA